MQNGVSTSAPGTSPGATPGAPDSPAPASQPLTPIAPGERLGSLDALRGFALLGILMVNMPLFGLPLMVGFGGPALADGPASDRVAWWIVIVGFQWSFISLFSLLFGAGFAMMSERAAARGQSIVGPYLRRAALLMCFGALHAVLLWMGDILFAYGLLALPLLAFGWLRPKTLAIVGAALVLFGIVASAGTAALQGVILEMSGPPSARTAVVDGMPLEEDAVDPAPSESSDGIREEAEQNPPPRGFDAMVEAQFNPASPIWIEAETAAHVEGPYLTAMGFRVMFWLMSIVSGLFTYAWYVLGCFFIGAAMMKAGYFRARPGPELLRLQGALLLAIPVGLAVKTLYGLIAQGQGWEQTPILGLGVGIHMLGAILLSLGITAAGCRLIQAGLGERAPLRWIMRAGRMPLTLYLMQSLIAVAIMDHWGLARFGSVDRMSMIWLTLAIWVGQVALANIWLSVFRTGPLEWLWRLGTYLKAPPLRR